MPRIHTAAEIDNMVLKRRYRSLPSSILLNIFGGSTMKYKRRELILKSDNWAQEALYIKEKRGRLYTDRSDEKASRIRHWEAFF